MYKVRRRCYFGAFFWGFGAVLPAAFAEVSGAAEVCGSPPNLYEKERALCFKFYAAGQAVVRCMLFRAIYESPLRKDPSVAG